MLCALDMSVHSTHIVYGVECPCRGFHIDHGFECSGTNCIALVCGNTTLHQCVHGTDLALHLVLNHVGLGMGRSQIEFHSVKRKWKMKCVERSK